MKRIAVFAAIMILMVVAGLAYHATGSARAGDGSIAGIPPVGDVNCSGNVDSVDALLVLQAAAGLATYVCPASRSDVNWDGVIDAVDAALILQYTAGLIEGFPPGVVHYCDPSYPTVCIPPPPPDLDCDDIEEFNFQVVGDDPHDFDPDGNGIGCESIVVVP